jgi:chorismate mutase
MTETPSTDQAPMDQLLELRASIDNFDAALVHILAERFRVTKAVGVLKAQHEFPPSDPAREGEQIERLRRLAERSNLDPDFLNNFLNLLSRKSFNITKKRVDNLIHVNKIWCVYKPTHGKSLEKEFIKWQLKYVWLVRALKNVLITKS